MRDPGPSNTHSPVHGNRQHRATELRPTRALPRHSLVEPFWENPPLLQRPDQGYKMPTYVLPLVPRLLTNVIGHSV